MIIHYQNKDKKEVFLKNIIYIQNINNDEVEAVCNNNKTLTLRIDRIEAVLNDELIPEERKRIKRSKNLICCSNCTHLEISGAYGECGIQLRLVRPDDTCKKAERRRDFKRCKDCVYQKVCRLRKQIEKEG